MFMLDFARLPCVSMTGKVSEKSGWSHNGRTMQVNMLVIIHSGECVFRIRETDYKYHAGDIALVPKNTFYSPHTETHCEYTFFHFNGELETCSETDVDITSVTGTGKPFYGVVENGSFRLFFDYRMPLSRELQNIELWLSKCMNTEQTGQSRLQLLLSLQFSEMMLHISQSFCAQMVKENSYPAVVGRILLFIKENYTHNITLDDICSQAGVTKQYCMRLFRQHLNTTINDYILDLRMRHAAYLLRRTYMNVNEAADYLGYSSVSYFSRVFKRYYGTPPSRYST